MLRQSLLYALEALESANAHDYRWKYNPQHNPSKNNPYQWCSIGWERNGFRGYYYDIPNVLRPLTPTGDLIEYWQVSRPGKPEMVALFTRAVHSLPKVLDAA